MSVDKDGKTSESTPENGSDNIKYFRPLPPQGMEYQEILSPLGTQSLNLSEFFQFSKIKDRGTPEA